MIAEVVVDSYAILAEFLRFDDMLTLRPCSPMIFPVGESNDLYSAISSPQGSLSMLFRDGERKGPEESGPWASSTQIFGSQQEVPKPQHLSFKRVEPIPSETIVRVRPYGTSFSRRNSELLHLFLVSFQPGFQQPRLATTGAIFHYLVKFEPVQFEEITQRWNW